MANVSFLLILISYLSLIVGCTTKDHVWRVAIVGTPARIIPTDIHLLTTSYILKQTHEALFIKDRNNNFRSTILDRWERSEDYRIFHLCIKTPKAFDEGQFFTSEDLRKHIERILHRQKTPKFHLVRDNDCVGLEFSKSFIDFLFIFSDLENSPSKPSKIIGVENGLGDFLVKEFTKDLVRLKRKWNSPDYINQIDFYNIEAIAKKPEIMATLDDINHLFLKSISALPKDKFIHFDYRPLKEYVLLINHPEKEIRRAIFDCVNINKLRVAAYLEENDFIDVSTLIPVGIPGGKLGQVVRNCVGPSAIRKLGNKPLSLKIWESINEAGIRESFVPVFEDMIKSNFVIEKEKYSDLIRDVVERNYDLFLVVVDTRESSYIPFFEYVFDKEKSFVNHKISEGIKLFEKLKETRDLRKQFEISIKLQEMVFSEYLVLPIYQPIRRFYYPKNVSGLFLLDDFLDFPKLNRIEY